MEFGFEPVCDQLRTSFELASVMEFGFKTYVYLFCIIGLDACPLNRDQVRSLDCAVNSCFGKIFYLRSQTVIDECKTFNCPAVSG